MRKLRLFLAINKKSKLMLLEAFILLAWGRYLKLIPFSKVVKRLGEQMKETSYEFAQKEQQTLLKQVSQTVHLASRYTFWESECLVKAIAAVVMLKRRGVESTLYLGTGKDEEGKLVAHAWVRSGSYYITGSEGMEHFTIVATFANYVIA